MTRVLVVDDEPSVRKIATAYLEREGFAVRTAVDGEQALEEFASGRPSLIVLDLMLPKLDGYEVCRRVREKSNVPILMLTARGEEFERVLGLELGADDYVVKPFSPRELVARVKAILRRTAGEEEPASLQHADLRVDPVTRAVHVGDQRVDLSAIEFDLLYTLAQQPEKVFSRDELIRRVWGNDFPGVDRVVDVHMVSLRRKLGERGDAPRFIHTVRTIGYRFSIPEG
ncbi:response regulator transcription factor [Deinococcus peraridilitoris]|uniref:Response regulator with CheY-like receiver domain and winged-helix DNA-binding domain protein n=1 Tax=Deinococcus peraridilitoris (strain DSM 19664 / LMG 22246 / CIP 109416 / KR-200) TaxID=937777 RepID=L0A9B0_DEIPD|nr:response regulator transcription factor [Deinococcus peraridilitoris]AFZ69717.1 response regulator with CheY-like receiver domain and winged-helix DNA-binding domain protein [Deinococcus peraridilitoris DSM 19664]